MLNPLNTFTTHLRSVLLRAAELAVAENSPMVEVSHLMRSLTRERGAIAADVLARLAARREVTRTTRVVRPIATKTNTRSAPSAREIPIAPTVQRAVERAMVIAAEHAHRYVGTEHLLSALLQIDSAGVKQALALPKLNLATVRQRLSVALKSAGKFPELADSAATPVTTAPEPATDKKKVSKTPALDMFGVDLTNQKNGRPLDPVIGRAHEIERVIHILSRRTKNNPLLLGEPGVGKTAIVEGLARRISEGTVPHALAGKRIVALDLPQVVAGTVYRGEFEGRLKQLIDEVKRHPDVILFVDEVHTITGAGAASGSIDAANMLKPALARGEIRLIGATTATEYKKHIETDAALERRFETVAINEPSEEETRTILAGIRSYYEQFHRVTITDDAIDRAVGLAARYFPDKRFPDKAIDLLDETAAAVRVRAGADPHAAQEKILVRERTRANERKEQAVRDEKFDEALAAKNEEDRLTNTIKALTRDNLARPVIIVNAEEVVATVGRIRRMHTETLNVDDADRLMHLAETLKQSIVGQDEAIATVAARVRRASAGFTDTHRPLASFLFLGPTGVGKTALARALATALYSDPHALIRLDMSEFSEPFTASKLVGAPAGYVGYRDSATLTDAVKRQPHSVVLFDEIEKAHPDVVHLLLQILEEGMLTDATGRTISFANTIVILTSNAGRDMFRGGPVGFGSTQSMATAVREKASERLSPELMNRLDAVCVFAPLTRVHLPAIVNIGLRDLGVRLGRKSIQLAPSESACARLADLSYNEGAGARDVRRVIEEQVENRVADLLITGEVKPNQTLMISVDEKQGIQILNQGT